MISTVIVTYNSEKVLKDCLDSVKGSDEIIIVDLGSNDQTLDLAKKYGAKIFVHGKVEYVEKVRNFAISKATGDWVLVLDPDERIPSVLWEKLKNIDQKFAAVNIPRKNIFFGRWILHTNWWPDKHVRFFKKGKVTWSEKIHLYPKVDGKILELPAKESMSIEHFGYHSVSDFIERQNRYSEILAKNLYEDGNRFSWFNFFWYPVREFLVRYIKHLGFLDGYYGFILTYLMMIYQLEVQIKLWEMDQK